MITIEDIIKAIEYENIKYIFLDCDGVIIKSVKAMCELLNERYNKNINPVDILSWNFSEYGSINSNEIESIFNDKKFFEIIEFYDGVVDFIKEYENKIICVTKGLDENIERKKLLFEKYDINIPIIGLPLNMSKDIINMNGCLFIDDCVSNLNESNAMIKILFKEFDNDAEWQRNWNCLTMNAWI